MSLALCWRNDNVFLLAQQMDLACKHAGWTRDERVEVGVELDRGDYDPLLHHLIPQFRKDFWDGSTWEDPSCPGAILYWWRHSLN